MKTARTILFFCFAILVFSCTEKEEAIKLAFSKDVVLGTFNITSINEEIEDTVLTSGVEVNVSKTKSRADTFEVDFTLNRDNTYTASGKYRKIITVTPTGKSSETLATIIVFSDSGKFSLNENENTITFDASSEEFLNGTYLVTSFDGSSFSLQKEKVTVIDQITSTSDIEITFEKVN